MKIDVEVKLDENKQPVHALLVDGQSAMGSPVIRAINGVLIVVFRAVEMGVVAEFRVGQVTVGQFLFMSCAGAKGWLKTAERLQKTMAELLGELDTAEGDVGVTSTETPCLTTVESLEPRAPEKQIFVPGQANRGTIAMPGRN